MSNLMWPPESAELLAAELVDAAELEIWNALPLTDHRGAAARNRLKMQQIDQGIARKLQGSGYIYFGHTIDHDSYLFAASAAGYGLTPEHVRAEPHNWIWDEVLDLNSEHPDVAATIREYGYNTKYELPERPYFVGGYVLPKTVLAECMVTLYERARFARLEGFGFPWTSDPIPEDLLPISEPQASKPIQVIHR